MIGAYDIVTEKAAEEFADPDLDPYRIRATARRYTYLVVSSLKKWLLDELASYGLWAPVFIAIGIGLYFGLKTEPPVWVSLAAVLALAFCGWLFPVAQRAFLILALVALGFCAADWRTERVSSPILAKEIDIREIYGRVVMVEDGDRGQRLLLNVHSIEGVALGETPERIRLRWRGEPFNIEPGQFIQIKGGLRPPAAPAAPGAFDYARQLYFQRIGAVGYAVTQPIILEQAAQDSSNANLDAWVEQFRTRMAGRILAASPGDGGAIVAAMLTGKREAISDSARSVLRDAGLAHLLAISGLHMGLATGLIFFVVRFLLALVAPLALRLPIKKWAALAALMGGFAYLLLSGGGWSARRAFIMTAIMLVAILLDRRALSLRNVAIAATIILLTTPEAIVHPGFQMSFAAVTALIAFYEWLSARASNPDFSLRARVRRYIGALAATDIIAASATAPYALFHFNRVAVYSLPASLLAGPVMGFWIMPTAIAGLLLAPIGLDGWAWRLSAQGVEFVLSAAETVTAWRGAVQYSAQWPLAALLALTLGGLLLTLGRTPLRILGLASVPVAMIFIAARTPPDIFIASSGRNAGYIEKSEGGGVAVFSNRRDRFSASIWRESLGFSPHSKKIYLMRKTGECDGNGCVIVTPEGRKLSFLSEQSGLAEDCARADLVVALFYARQSERIRCGARLIDRADISNGGAHAIWMERNGSFRIKTVNAARGRRPWTGPG